jgi:type I restriction enzyme, S subunit
MRWGYPLVEIGDLVSVVKKWNPRQSKTNELINYIDIASVNRETKEVEDVMEVFAHEAPSRARQLVMDGDVLVSTVRPNLNAVAHLKTEFSGATASTGFAVLRPNSKKVCDRYLYYWVRSPYFVQDMVRRSTGASYPAVSDSIVKAYNIPLPPLEEQKRIAAILDKADAIRQKRKEAISLTEELLRSTFLDMFGDPVGRNTQWKQHNLGDLLSVVSGQVDPKTEPYIDMPHIGGDNIESNTGVIHKVKTPRELNLISGKYLFEPTDILYSKIRPYLNKVSIPAFTGICSADIYPLRVNKEIVDKNYLVYLLRSNEFLSYTEKHSARTNIPKINRPALLKFTSKLPPLDSQKKFSQIYINVHSMKKRLKLSIDESNIFFNSLLQKAFRGEL